MMDELLRLLVSIACGFIIRVLYEDVRRERRLRREEQVDFDTWAARRKSREQPKTWLN